MIIAKLHDDSGYAYGPFLMREDRAVAWEVGPTLTPESCFLPFSGWHITERLPYQSRRWVHGVCGELRFKGKQKP